MRRSRSSNRGLSAILSLMVIAALVAGACGDDNPAGPTPPTRQTASAQSVSISGPTTLQAPGDTAQLTLTATFPDGSTRNVSTNAGWSVDHPDVVAVFQGGFLTARGYGQCYVTARYGALSARAPMRVIPEGMFLLSGRVTEESGLPLRQVRVSATSSAGEMSTSTSQEGVYQLPARGDVVVRAVMDGFESQVERLTVAQDEGLDFQLRFSDSDFGGMYRLVFTASPSCALPSEAMRRSYIAQIVEASSGSVSVVLSGAEFVAFGEAGFTGRREGAIVRFEIASDPFFDPVFVELLDATRELAYSGTATGQVGDTFVTTFSGLVVVRQRAFGVLTQCEAGDHRLEFTR